MVVKDVPEYADYQSIGSDYLQLAWDQVANLLTGLDDSFEEYDLETKSDYWHASRRTLLTALTIAQQGVELILKGYIAEVSPYLLLQNPSGNLPKSAANSDLSFADFKTIDAHELLKMVRTFTNLNLSAQFHTRFEELRSSRNQIMHSTGEQVSIQPMQLVEIILEVHIELFPQNHWPKDRLDFLNRSPISQLSGGDFSRNILCWELEQAIDLLKPAKVKKFFGIDKKQHRYACPECMSNANRDGGFPHHLAVLKPASPTSTNLYCFVCDKDFNITRKKCIQKHCKCNVFHDDWECLLCT